MQKSISYEEFVDLILDPDTTEEELEKYIEVDHENSQAYQPSFKFKDGAISNPRIESALILNTMNAWSRASRNRKYKRKINNGYTGKIIVSEGDSWFQYPIKLYDVIDHISDKYAVFSLGAAGDWLDHIIEQDDYLRAIEREDASIFLISGGGNDLVGGERLKRLLKPFEPGLSPEKYLGKEFIAFVEKIESQYRFLFDSIYQTFPTVQILCHGYDYTIPNSGKWFGRPMEKIGIIDKQLQLHIARHITDRFNNLMQNISKDYETVTYVNCKDTVGNNRWHDELHPNDEAFKDVADKFIKVIEQV